jgi:hypothetical protein
MDPSRKGTLVFGTLLIVFGVIFLAMSLIPGFSIGMTWPIVFFLIAAGFYLPVFVWPEARQGLAALFIPGSIFLTMGMIFTYNVITRDWVVWAYAWMLLAAGVGGGLALASSFGGWSRNVFWVGLWMLAIATGLFGLFATLFGTPALKIIGALVVLSAGVFLLVRSLRK